MADDRSEEAPMISTAEEPDEALEASAPSAIPGLVCIVAGLLVVVGSFLAWFSVTVDETALGGSVATISARGMDGGGKVTVVAGVVLVIAGGLMFALRRSTSIVMPTVALVAALVAAVRATFDVVLARRDATGAAANAIGARGRVSADQARLVLSLVNVRVGVEFGVVLVIVAAIVAAIAGANALWSRRTSQPFAVSAGGETPAPPPVRAFPYEGPHEVRDPASGGDAPPAD